MFAVFFGWQMALHSALKPLKQESQHALLSVASLCILVFIVWKECAHTQLQLKEMLRFGSVMMCHDGR